MHVTILTCLFVCSFKTHTHTKKQEASIQVKSARHYLHRKSFEELSVIFFFFFYTSSYLTEAINYAYHMFAMICSNRRSRIQKKKKKQRWNETRRADLSSQTSCSCVTIQTCSGIWCLTKGRLCCGQKEGERGKKKMLLGCMELKKRRRREKKVKLNNIKKKFF